MHPSITSLSTRPGLKAVSSRPACEPHTLGKVAVRNALPSKKPRSSPSLSKDIQVFELVDSLSIEVPDVLRSEPRSLLAVRYGLCRVFVRARSRSGAPSSSQRYSGRHALSDSSQ